MARTPTEPSPDWLEALNARLSSEGIPPHRRPFLAVQRWSQESGSTVIIPSPVANRIFEWYESIYPSLKTSRPLFTGAFFFDAAFWPFFIPLCYGNAEVRPLDLLPTMTGPVKSMLSHDSIAVTEYLATWNDCYEYTYKMEGVIGHSRRPPSVSGDSLKWMRASDTELRATVALLLESPANPDAIFRARAALEKALKGLLAGTESLTEKEARQIRHGLPQLLKRAGVSLEVDLLTVYPPHAASYEGTLERSPAQLWLAYKTAQRICRMAAGRLSVD